MIGTFESVNSARALYCVELRPCDNEALRISWGDQPPQMWPRASYRGVVAVGHPQEWRTDRLIVGVAVVGGGFSIDFRLFRVLALWGAASESIVRGAIVRGAKWMAVRGIERHRLRKPIVYRLVSVLLARRAHLEAEARMPAESRAALARSRTIERGSSPLYAPEPDYGAQENARARMRSLDI